ncbi:lipid-A-disaccharide synthase [bacterium]|nr:lipid-A-disaccharide synthase [bacterium]
MKALIVTGEASGDLYGGKIARQLQSRLPGIELAGMGGRHMQEADVCLLFDYSSVTVIGVFEVFSKLKQLHHAFSLLKQWVQEQRPECAILIDFPDFNFRMARILKKLGIKIFYFVSPQIWAWRKNRVNFLRNHVDLMICVLPFEKSIYEEAGVPAVYCGHPLIEIVQEELSKQPPFEIQARPVLGLMPGSRDVEIGRHFPVMLDAARRIYKARGGETLIMWPPSLKSPGFDVPTWARFVQQNRYAAMSACDVLLVASGTSTLECAILGVPLLIVYRVSPVSWQLGKVLVRVPYYGLVNWIAGEKVVPEFMQDHMNPDDLCQATLALLDNPDEIQRMKENLRKVVESLGPPRAIQHAVEEIAARL